MRSIRCTTCGDPLGFNPKRTETPTGGWYHAGEISRMKDDPDYHHPNLPEGAHGPAVAAARQAALDQARMAVKEHLSRQFDALRNEKVIELGD